MPHRPFYLDSFHCILLISHSPNIDYKILLMVAHSLYLSATGRSCPSDGRKCQSSGIDSLHSLVHYRSSTLQSLPKRSGDVGCRRIAIQRRERGKSEQLLLLLFMPLPVPSFLSLTPISSSSWGEGLFISPKRDSTALIAAQLSWTPVPIFRTRKGTKKYICLTLK